jgi:hypothetical protein
MRVSVALGFALLLMTRLPNPIVQVVIGGGIVFAIGLWPAESVQPESARR